MSETTDNSKTGGRCAPALGSARLESAYVEGWQDGDQGYPKDHNPYRKGTAEREWWHAGWLRSLDELCGT